MVVRSARQGIAIYRSNALENTGEEYKIRSDNKGGCYTEGWLRQV